jgi:hypothetical protein
MVFGLWICDIFLEDNYWLSWWMFWYMVEAYVGFMNETLSWWVGIYMRCMVWWCWYIICTCLLHYERYFLVILLVVCVLFLTHYLYTCIGILVHIGDGCRLMQISMILFIWLRELHWWVDMICLMRLMWQIIVTVYFWRCGGTFDRVFLSTSWFFYLRVGFLTSRLVLRYES